MQKINMKRIVIFLFVCFICLGLLELFVRVIGRTDENNQFIFGTRIQPYVIPVQSLWRSIEAYEQAVSPYLIPDEVLGWTIAKNAKHSNGLFFSNSNGFRDHEGVDEWKNQEEKIRIMLFGDSFIHGDDVMYEKSVSGQLAGFLSDRSQVLDFGVPGYGLDQAYLRWLKEGRDYRPTYVLIGFQPENCKRNLNIFRLFYSLDTTIPFSKPRFVLDKNEMKLVNSPVINYRQIPDSISHFENNPLAPYEYFYQPDQYKFYWWSSIKLIGITNAMMIHFSERALDQVFYGYDSDSMRLCRSIINTFVSDVKNQGAVPIVVHIPPETIAKNFIKSKKLPYQKTLNEIKEEVVVVDPLPVYVKFIHDGMSLKDLYIPHYSEVANTLLAQLIADAINSKK
jgi:hypothetical protein